ncbi:MAG: hypothetical protein HOP04_14645 [Methylophilaceae bacterium]|nr:hypothetical protein [Methylophilaceae bacterium]
MSNLPDTATPAGESLISAMQQRRSAQAFNFFSCVAILIPVLIPIWIAASIVVYATVAHHPNQQVRDFLTPAGYRFYGLVGALVVTLNFSSMMAAWVGGGLNLALIIWASGFLIVFPLGVRDIMRAQKFPWQDIKA